MYLIISDISLKFMLCISKTYWKPKGNCFELKPFALCYNFKRDKEENILEGLSW